MAVRIYSLAKELNLDSKVLVDLLARAGVTGKGSALASLTDEEAAKVRAFVAGGGKAPREAAAPAAPVAAPIPQVSPVSVAAAPPTPAAPVALRREDYVPPSGAALGKPPVLTGKKKDDGAGDAPRRTAGEAAKPPARSGPAIRVAPLPPSSAPPPPPVSAEPEPQKPDIKLPMDAIRASRAGGKPLEAHMRKAQQQAAAASRPPVPAGAQPPRSRAPGPPSRGGMPPVGPPVMPDEGRDRSRKTGGGKGKDEPATLAESGLSWREQRQLSRRRHAEETKSRIPLSLDDEESARRARLRPKRHQPQGTVARKGRVVVALPATVRSFSEAVGVRIPQVLGKLLAMGAMANLNTELTTEQVELLAVDLGLDIDLKAPQDLEAELLAGVRDFVDAPEALEPRAPIVTFLGHVDHGKTSLLDRIIGIDVASKEAGGITQHIRAYRLEKDGRAIAFVDTPGHEAFTEMRARGANVTDVAVLVVAADDGVMPQTEEAISHARAANVPIVVALNKTDLPGVNYDRIYTQLVTAGVQPTDWGGDTELVRCSAMTGAGIDQLLETILTIAELHDYRANPQRPGFGTCLEAELHEGRGVTAKFVVQNGTLRVGDIVVCGAAHGRVKAMYDTLNPRVTYQEAGPSTPVNVTGLDIAPNAGDHFYVVDDIVRARDIATKRSALTRQASLGGGPVHVTLENLFERLGGDEAKTLNLILRADTRGSIEAIRKEMAKLDHPEVQIKILQATVGGITEADVHLADASDAIIVGFNVVPDEKARSLADAKGVQIRRYDIIYQVTDDVKLALEGLLKPEQRQVELGRAVVLRTFTISRIGTVAGCRVLSGTIERNCRMRVIRDSRVIGEYGLDSLKREKDDAREVREGYECGIKLAGFNDVKEGDVFEAYRVEEVARTL